MHSRYTIMLLNLFLLPLGASSLKYAVKIGHLFLVIFSEVFHLSWQSGRKTSCKCPQYTDSTLKLRRGSNLQAITLIHVNNLDLSRHKRTQVLIVVYLFIMLMNEVKLFALTYLHVNNSLWICVYITVLTVWGWDDYYRYSLFTDSGNICWYTLLRWWGGLQRFCIESY